MSKLQNDEGDWTPSIEEMQYEEEDEYQVNRRQLRREVNELKTEVEQQPLPPCNPPSIRGKSRSMVVQLVKSMVKPIVKFYCSQFTEKYLEKNFPVVLGDLVAKYYNGETGGNCVMHWKKWKDQELNGESLFYSFERLNAKWVLLEMQTHCGFIEVEGGFVMIKEAHDNISWSS